MEQLIEPSSGDVIREAIIVLIGLLIRAIEKRRMKTQTDAKS